MTSVPDQYTLPPVHTFVVETKRELAENEVDRVASRVFDVMQEKDGCEWFIIHACCATKTTLNIAYYPTDRQGYKEIVQHYVREIMCKAESPKIDRDINTISVEIRMPSWFDRLVDKHLKHDIKKNVQYILKKSVHEAVDLSLT